jgi:putative tricarboxylic transport membrane protein
MFKGFISLILGLFFTTVGMDRYTATPRLNFGTLELMRGIDIIPVAVGLMGLSEIILSIVNAEFIEIKKGDPSLKFNLKGIFPTIKEIIFCIPTAIRSMIVGFFVGILPGAGASIASNLAYEMEKQVASDRENFGKGTLQGVTAPEAANNACVSGAMVTMLSLGIPGSNSTALLLGALIMVGIQPGPGLVTRAPDVFWGLISSMYIGNIMLVIMCIALIPVFLFLLRVSQKTLPVIIGILCVVGTYGSQNALFDVGVMLFFAIIGLFFKSLNFPVAPMVIGIVLGSEFEVTFRQTMGFFRNDLGLFFTRPIASVLFFLCIVMIVLPVIRWTREQKKKKALVAG